MGSLGRLLIGPRLGRIGLARLLVRVRVGRLHPIGRGILPGHGPGLLLAVSAVGKPVQAGETRLLVFHHTGDGTMLVMMAAKYTKAERVPKAVERKWKKSI